MALFEYKGKIKSREKIDDDDTSLEKEYTEELSEQEKILKNKTEIEKKIDNLAEKMSNKRGIDIALCRLKVLEEDPDLYAEYKAKTDPQLKNKRFG